MTLRPSAFYGAQLARILREQRRAGRVAWMAERRAATLLGGRGLTAAWASDLAGRVRAATSFGLTGGELCGCGEVGCESCSCVGARRCSCNLSSCSVCAALGSGPMGATARKAAAAALPATAYPGRAPERAPDTPFETWDLPIGWLTPLSGEYIDIHSHNFCAGKTDWEGTRESTNDRLSWLYKLRGSGLNRMAFSGMADTPGSFGTGDTDFVDGSTLDDITQYTIDRYDDFFIPFVRGFTLADSDLGDYVESWLAAGFEGVGEMFVHAEGGDHDDNTRLLEIGKVAARYGVPILVHWDMGAVKVGSPTTAAENYTQLIELLDAFPNVPIAGYSVNSESDPVPLKVIIAHCGIGPGAMTASELVDWESRLDDLLTIYPNVFFDMAGMQIDGTASGTRITNLQLFDPSLPAPTPAGSIVLEKMFNWPTRFLFGVDTENRSEAIADVWSASVANYATFLGMGALSAGALSAAQQSLIKAANALYVLGARATGPSAASAGDDSIPSPFVDLDVSFPW